MPDGHKTQPNRGAYIAALRRMSPEQRLGKAFELSDMTHEALRAGLSTRFPEADPATLAALYVERLERCRSRNS